MEEDDRYGYFDQPTVDQETLESPKVEALSTYFSRETPEVLNKLLGMASNKATSIGESMHSGAETGVNALADFFFKPQGFRSSQDLLSSQDNAHSMIDKLIEDFSYFQKGIQDTDEPWFPNSIE